jgi:hypothetical protein
MKENKDFKPVKIVMSYIMPITPLRFCRAAAKIGLITASAFEKLVMPIFLFF